MWVLWWQLKLSRNINSAKSNATSHAKNFSSIVRFGLKCVLLFFIKRIKWNDIKHFWLHLFYSQQHGKTHLKQWKYFHTFLTRNVIACLSDEGPTPGPVFSLARSKLRLRAGYFSNLAGDWLSTVWAYSELETENGPNLRWLNNTSHATVPTRWTNSSTAGKSCLYSLNSRPLKKTWR